MSTSISALGFHSIYVHALQPKYESLALVSEAIDFQNQTLSHTFDLNVVFVGYDEELVDTAGIVQKIWFKSLFFNYILGCLMKNQRTFSTAKFFALCIVFMILGLASAVAVTTLVPPMAQRPSGFMLLTDKDTYYINEAMIIYVMNTLQETVNFKDDAYGLHFERWVNGEWEFMLSIGKSSRTTALQAIGEDMYKAAVTYELGENFVEGKYEVVSVGEINQNGVITSSEAHKEFNVIQKPLPQTVLPLLTVKTDKAVYGQNDNVTVTLENESNEAISFADSSYSLFFEKWNGASWEFYTGVGAVEVITTLDPSEKVEIIFRPNAHTEKPFLQGRYRAVSVGWIYRNGEFVQVGGLTEFNVE